MQNTYDNNFFEYINFGSISSAQKILPLLVQHLDIKSVLDVGCGQGAWLSIWNDLGVTDYRGTDGEYVEKQKLLIEQEKFFAQDLSLDFDLQRKFDLVQSLEVAEHIPEKDAKTFVSNLVKHGELVMFSAAPKGQGGDQHINEQHYEYWRKHFLEFDFHAIDFVRPCVKGIVNIEPWYRYNIILYAAESVLAQLPEAITSRLLLKDEAIKDISPFWYRTRKRIVRTIPISWQTKLAKIKEKLVVLIRS